MAKRGRPRKETQNIELVEQFNEKIENLPITKQYAEAKKMADTIAEANRQLKKILEEKKESLQNDMIANNESRREIVPGVYVTLETDMKHKLNITKENKKDQVKQPEPTEDEDEKETSSQEEVEEVEEDVDSNEGEDEIFAADQAAEESSQDSDDDLEFV